VPATDSGEQLGLHGPISTTPAEQVSWSETWTGEDCVFTIKGAVRESSVHGANLLMERTLTSSLRSNALEIHDVVTNEGVRETPMMILYHFNFGYPLLTEQSEVHSPSITVDSIDAFSEESEVQWAWFEAPVQNQKERVYFHDMQVDRDGKVAVVLVQDRKNPEFGVALRYEADTLPQFVQWKMTGENHFVLGLEPSNCRTLGRVAERDRGTLQMLQPGESKTFRLTLEVLDGSEKVKDAISATRKS
jgi:hypothetical protein